MIFTWTSGSLDKRQIEKGAPVRKEQIISKIVSVDASECLKAA